MKTKLLFKAWTIGLSTRNGRKPVSLKTAARHNLREIQAELGCRGPIDPTRCDKNQVLHGPSTAREITELAESIKSRYAVPKSKLRRDHVQALEFMVSLPRKSAINVEEYFGKTVEWFKATFGVEVLLSVVVHQDESAPHMHVLVLPIRQGQYVGGAPLKPSSLKELTQRFANEVGCLFGLSFERYGRMTEAQRIPIVESVLAQLGRTSDPAVSSSIWPAVRADIERSPVSYAELLSLPMEAVKPVRKMRKFVDIMISTGKRTPEDRERNRST